MAMLFARAKNRSLSAPLKLNYLTPFHRLNHNTSTDEGTMTQPKMGAGSASPRGGPINMKKWKKLDGRALGINGWTIPQPTWTVLNTLRRHDFETYLVGGCVRDLVLNRVPKDFDIITTADLKQIKKCFNKAIIIGIRFPICQVNVKGSKIEVSSFDTVARHDETKQKFDLPPIPKGCDETDFIRWNNSMQRDFTINSLFFDPFSFKVYDYANGIADLRSLKLRTLISAQMSFEEDCARILRGLRIAARLGLSISKETEAAMHNLSWSIQSLDNFRLMLEMNYMLSYGAAEPSISLLKRFNLLQILFPFHAAYLDEQSNKKFDQNSNMLMKLLFNLDKLVCCERPSDCSLWVGLLAFHLALVNNPQDAFVVWTFASVLYHGKWSEGVQFAREHAKRFIHFEPEFSGFSPSKSDEELAAEVSQFAYFVQVCVNALSEARTLEKFMSRYPGFPNSGVVFIPKRIVKHAREILNVLVEHIESYDHGRESFMIDYKLFMRGNFREIRFVFGKILLQTVSDGLLDEKKGVAEELQNSLKSDMVEDTKGKMDKKRKLFEKKLGPYKKAESDKEWQAAIKESAGKAKEHQNEVEACRLPDLYQLLQQELSEERVATAENEEFEEMAQKHVKLAETVKHDELQNTALPKVSARNNGSWQKKVKPKKLLERKDYDAVVQTEVKSRSKRPKEKTVKEKSSRSTLSSIFRR